MITVLRILKTLFLYFNSQSYKIFYEDLQACMVYELIGCAISMMNSHQKEMNDAVTVNSLWCMVPLLFNILMRTLCSISI